MPKIGDGKSRALMRAAEQRNRNQAMDAIRMANGYAPCVNRQAKRFLERKRAKAKAKADTVKAAPAPALPIPVDLTGLK